MLPIPKMSQTATDPRVQIELENLNTSTEFINKLELELEKARADFQKLLKESTTKIEGLSKKLSPSIDKARPYYEARQAANELHLKAQEETRKFQKSAVEQDKAKEVNQTVEKKIQEAPDVELEHILTKTAEKVNKCELERREAERDHESTAREYNLTEQKLTRLHNQLKGSIIKASFETRRNLLEINNIANQHQLQLLPYFEMKAQFNQMLEEQLNRIRSYEERVNQAKANYNKALERLEDINSKIYGDQSLADELLDATSADVEDPELKFRDESIKDDLFNNRLLDELLLDSNDIDTTIEQLKCNTLQ